MVRCTIYLEPSEEFRERANWYRRRLPVLHAPAQLHMTVAGGHFTDAGSLLRALERVADSHSPVSLQSGRTRLLTNPEYGNNALVSLIDKTLGIDALHWDTLATIERYVDLGRYGSIDAFRGLMGFGKRYLPHITIAYVPTSYEPLPYSPVAGYQWKAKSLNISGDITASFPFQS